VSSLLAKQADVTAATNDGLTALMTASYKVRSRPQCARARKECTVLTLACGPGGGRAVSRWCSCS
jgi:hypothetical protein